MAAARDGALRVRGAATHATVGTEASKAADTSATASDDAAAGPHIGFLLARAHQRFRSRMLEALEGTGLHLGHVTVLGALSSGGPMSQRDLGELTGIEKSTMVLVVDTLEAMRLVQRRAAATDRRAYAIELTAAGARLLRTVGPRLQATEDRLLAGLGAARRRALQAALQQLIAASGE